jgi:hypothetical protein
MKRNDGGDREAAEDVIMALFAERWLSGRKRPPAKWVEVVKLLSGSNPDLSARIRVSRGT